MKDFTAEIEEIRNTETVIDSATAFITGTAARVQAAVDAALANGATEAQIQPVVDVIAELNGKSQELAGAIAANTPGAPTEV